MELSDNKVGINMKYVKVMNGLTSHANGYEYKIDEVNIADNWNPNADNAKNMGGFNFSTEDKILRWLVRGDTIYDVEIPEDTEIVNVESIATPNGVFRSNKIILRNPRPITDEYAYELYLKSNIPEKSYYKALAGLMVRGYEKTAMKLIQDKVNESNIDIVLSEINDFIEPFKNDDSNNNEIFKEIMDYLMKIK